MKKSITAIALVAAFTILAAGNSDALTLERKGKMHRGMTLKKDWKRYGTMPMMKKGYGVKKHLPYNCGFNNATSAQNGALNGVSVAMKGCNNNAHVSQHGLLNNATVTQDGFRNNADVHQHGIHNNAAVLQNGQHNSATVEQNGFTNNAVIIQD